MAIKGEVDVALEGDDCNVSATSRSGIGVGLLLTAREVGSLDAAGLAAAAGCGAELVEAIEAGGVDPCLDTIERLVNAVALECRLGPGADGGLYSGGPDAGEVSRLRGELAAAAEHRAGLGLPALGVPEGSQLPWDGTDPAPARRHGAGDSRCGPGKSAILVRYFRSCTGLSVAEYAKRCGVAAAALEEIESGRGAARRRRGGGAAGAGRGWVCGPASRCMTTMTMGCTCWLWPTPTSTGASPRGRRRLSRLRPARSPLGPGPPHKLRGGLEWG